MSKMSLQTAGYDTALFKKTPQDFLPSAFFLLPRHVLCVLLLLHHISPLGKMLLEIFRSREHWWMQLGRGDQHRVESQAESKNTESFQGFPVLRHHVLHSLWL